MSSSKRTRFSSVRSELWVEEKLRLRLKRWFDYPELETSFGDFAEHETNTLRATRESMFKDLFCVACGTQMYRKTQSYLDWRKVKTCGKCSGKVDSTQCRHCGRNGIVCSSNRCTDCARLWSSVPKIVREEMLSYANVNHVAFELPERPARRASSVFDRVGKVADRADKLSMEARRLREKRPPPPRKKVPTGRFTRGELSQLRQMQDGMSMEKAKGLNETLVEKALYGMLRDLRGGVSAGEQYGFYLSCAFGRVKKLTEQIPGQSQVWVAINNAYQAYLSMQGAPTRKLLTEILTVLEEYEEGSMKREPLFGTIALLITHH